MTRMEELLSALDKAREEEFESIANVVLAEQTRYCVVCDNSGHRYYIPVDKDAEWDAFIKIDEDDERSWVAPEFAKRIDGHFTFTDPRCD